MFRFAPAAAELQRSCKGAPATSAWHCFNEVRRGHPQLITPQINLRPAHHATSALSLPRRHHHNPDIAMLPALRRVAPRITKTAVNARALSKGTMDMRPKGPISNPKLGIIRLDYDYEAAKGDIDHPGSFPCGTARSKANSHMATAKPSSEQLTRLLAACTLWRSASAALPLAARGASGSLCQSRRFDLICLHA